MADKNKLIITLHANGPSKDVNPNCAYSPKEIADQSLECCDLGASVVHFHACDPKTGAPAADTELYAETIRLIRRDSNMITFPTLGALASPSEGRVSHIIELAKNSDTRPDCIPLDVLTTNLDAWDSESKTYTSQGRIYANSTTTLIDIATRVRAVGVKPVPMLWNIAGVRVTETLVAMGVVEEPMFCEANVYGDPYLAFGHPATVKGLNALLDFIPPAGDWRCAVGVIGANPFALIANAIERGNDVAIGLHDYPFAELGYPTNADLVRRVVDLAHSMGREVATAAEAREILNMPK